MKIIKEIDIDKGIITENGNIKGNDNRIQ